MGCCAHLLNRIIAVASREDKLVGHCHAVHVVTRNPSQREKLRGVLRAAIYPDFEWLPGPPPVDHSAHLKAILEHTILRRLDHTTGSLLKECIDDRANSEVEGDGEVNQNRRRCGVQLCLKFCQSDPRGSKIIHYCVGCCSSREEALDNTTAAIEQAGLIRGFSSVTPSKGRHGSTTEALGEQSGGIMCYDVLPRTFQKCYPNWKSMNDAVAGEDGEGADDRKRWLRGKTYRSTKYLANKRDKMMATMLSWVTEPCDYLWMRLQYLDARHSTLVDAVDEKQSPFYACLSKLATMLLSPLDEGPLKTVFLHWGLGDPDGEWLASECQCTVASMYCQVYWRFILMLQSWPMPLAKVGKPGISFEELLSLFEELYNEDECCVDEDFALKLRGLAANAHELATCAETVQCIRLWARHTKMANMVTERLLARCKASDPERFPLIEKLIASSFLTQWMHTHISCTGVDPRKAATRADLLRRQVPLKAGARHRRRSAPSRPRGVCCYVRKHQMKVKLSRRARQAERSRLFKQFFALPSLERRPWIAQEQQKGDEGTITEDPDEKYTRLVDQKLFGVSSREEAYLEQEFKRIVDTILPEGSGQGMRNYAHLLRKSFAAKMVVKDTGAIPEKLKLSRRLPCRLRHPGLCPHKTPEIFEKGLRATDALIQHVVRNGSVGQVICLTSGGDERLFYGLLGYIRLKRPSQVVALAMQSEGGHDGHHRLRLSVTDDDPPKLCPMVSSEFIASALSGDFGIEVLKMSFMRVEWQVRFPGRCELLEVGDSETLLGGDLVGDVAGAPAGAKVAAAAAVGKDDDHAGTIAAGFACLPGLGSREQSGGAKRAPLKQVSVAKEAEDLVDEGTASSGSSSVSPDGYDSHGAPPKPKQSHKKPVLSVEKFAVVGDVAEKPADVATHIDDEGIPDGLLVDHIVGGSSSSTSKGGGSSSSGLAPADGGQPAPPANGDQPAPSADGGHSAPPAGGGPPVALAGGRGSRRIAWGPFSYSSVMDNKAGRQIGWGASCGRHFNPEDGARACCKKMITYGKENLSDEFCILQLKRWIYSGIQMTPEQLGAAPRTFHVSRIDARTVDGPSEAWLDAWAAGLPG